MQNKDHSPTSWKLSCEAKLENLTRVLEFISQVTELLKMPIITSTHLQIAVEEAFVNIVHHAYPNQEGIVEIHLNTLEDQEIEVIFMDYGKEFNPQARPDPHNLKASAEEREVGGLGIFFLKKFVDTIDYSRKADANILTLRKKKNGINPLTALSGTTEPRQVQTSFRATVENLTLAIEFVSDFAKAQGFSLEELGHIQLAVEEGYVNIATHAYDQQPEPGEVEIFCSYLSSGELEISLYDYGKAFDAPKQVQPDIEAPAEEREIGGLGLYFMNTLMDEVKYDRKEGKNLLKIVKSRSNTPEKEQ